MQRSLSLVFCSGLLLASAAVFAQPSLEKMQRKLAAEKQNTAQSFYKFELNAKMRTQAGLLLSPDMAVQKTNLQAWLVDKLELRIGVDVFIQKQAPADYAGTQISKLQQYYKGIKVEHGVVSEVAVNNKVRLLQLEFYPLPESLSIIPMLSEDAALKKAMQFAGAQQYVWENNISNNPEYAKPHGELVIVEDIFSSISGKMCLAYKFDVFAAVPASRQYIYVDVLDGKVVFTDVIIKHLDDGTAQQKNTSVPLAQTAKQSKHKLKSANILLSKKNKPARVNSFALASGYTKY